MNSCKVGDIDIGSGIPKICVPIIERKREDIIKYAKKLKRYNPDIVEWRADFYENVLEVNQTLKTIQAIKGELEHIPLIFTVRSNNEGGNLKIDSKEYIELIKIVSKLKFVDIVDVEIANIRKEKVCVLEEIKENCKLILSYHNFKQTPSVEDMEKIILNMEYFNPDIYKIAVMPLNKSDNINILQLAVDLENRLKKPVIIISMGKFGIASRICGEIFSSSITFASLEKSSAPGQIQIDKLRMILEIIHENYFKQ